jgi:hypothetical protein
MQAIVKRDYAGCLVASGISEIVEPPEHLKVKGDNVRTVVIVRQPNPVVSRKQRKLLISDRPLVTNPGICESAREIVDITRGNFQSE